MATQAERAGVRKLTAETIASKKAEIQRLRVSGLQKQIAREYAHRVEADPETCPVCCGDRLTTDQRYGGEVIHPESERYYNTLYKCLACDVWHNES